MMNSHLVKRSSGACSPSQVEATHVGCTYTVRDLHIHGRTENEAGRRRHCVALGTITQLWPCSTARVLFGDIRRISRTVSRANRDKSRSGYRQPGSPRLRSLRDSLTMARRRRRRNLEDDEDNVVTPDEIEDI